jgi:hypothetical protein
MGGACSAHEREMRNAYILVVNLKGRDHSEDLVVDGIILLKWILQKQVWRVWIGFTWLRLGTVDRIL